MIEDDDQFVKDAYRQAMEVFGKEGLDDPAMDVYNKLEPRSKPCPRVRTLNDVLWREDANVGLYDYLIEKCTSGPLAGIEEEAYLLMSLLLDIEMEGFVDVFHQLYSLREYEIVEAGLRRLKLNELADDFAEAKNNTEGI